MNTSVARFDIGLSFESGDYGVLSIFMKQLSFMFEYNAIGCIVIYEYLKLLHKVFCCSLIATIRFNKCKKTQDSINLFVFLFPKLSPDNILSIVFMNTHFNFV